MSNFIVIRDCCTSGNCDTCAFEPNHVFGFPVKVSQYAGTDEEYAKKCTRNWHEYKAELLPATDENIAKLRPGSQKYVRQRLNLS